MLSLVWTVLVLTTHGYAHFTNFADVACGRQGRSGRIVGGTDATPGEFPWIVSITRRGGHFCGGSVINSRWVLTAAHCLCGGTRQLGSADIKVTVGEHDLRRPSGRSLAVSRVLIHPDYICDRYVNDIAMLELRDELAWSESVRPACFPTQVQDSFTEADAVAAGWGWTSETHGRGGRANILQKVGLTVLSNDRCTTWYRSQGKKVTIQNTQMCAGYEEGGRDACWADSGGPLMVGSEGSTMVVGIVSTGIGCARPKLPGLYTRIANFVPWIGQTLRRRCQVGDVLHPFLQEPCATCNDTKATMATIWLQYGYKINDTYRKWNHLMRSFLKLWKIASQEC